MSFDLSAIQDSLKDSFEVEITHPISGEGGWFIEIASSFHAEAQAKVSQILDRSRKRRVNTPQQDEADGIALIVSRILGWRGLIANGIEVEFTPQKAAEIIANPKSYWLRTQIMDAIGDPSRPFGN